MRLTLQTFLTIDGVMQAPGTPDEDREGHFEHGGWQFPYGDEDFGAVLNDWLQRADAFLLGGKTYQIFSSYWPSITDPEHPIASRLNALPKYVASTTLTSVDWNNSTLLGSNTVAEIAKLKSRPGGELQVHGSGNLIQTLIDHDLVDEYRLLIYPIHLGAGKRLFQEGLKAAALRLTSSSVTSTGVIIATYEPDGAVRYGDYTQQQAE